MKLTVVIVNYNVKSYLCQCLHSVERAIRGLVAEVVVVDNASSDDSVAEVKRLFPWVRVIANQENVGFSRANNMAIRKSKSDYVLLLNPDTIVGEEVLSSCVAFMPLRHLRSQRDSSSSPFCCLAWVMSRCAGV